MARDSTRQVPSRLPGKRNTWWSPWLRKSILPFQNTATFKDDAGRKYTWSGIAPCEEPQLWVADVDFPIANSGKVVLGFPVACTSKDGLSKSGMTLCSRSFSWRKAETSVKGHFGRQWGSVTS
ncbi:hypothetical protein BD410DRAFT_525603 [Rickenella mellea]|uniref:Uncharacterized protein n=1 Tax=Rickenella mellea TaxID=50990 RepID=A0A4Y7QFV7_9AGAM|nr:hypothetical protein BD410DRAFT_525603 [Rickenella mellea]